MNYDWGKLANESKVAELFGVANNIDHTLPYAELWMGTHPTAPSTLTPSLTALSTLMTPSNLSPSIHSAYQTLPFLLKILSIRKALSIQAHPDKHLAQLLHSARPHIYKDANHKPEMAVALGIFEGLVGFRDVKELKVVLAGFAELKGIVSEEVLQKFMQVKEADVSLALRGVFESVLRSTDEKVSSVVAEIVTRLQSTDRSPGVVGVCERLVLRLNDQYPNDVGILCALFLNHVILNDGEAIYLAANEPHAYLSGGIHLFSTLSQRLCGMHGGE